MYDLKCEPPLRPVSVFADCRSASQIPYFSVDENRPAWIRPDWPVVSFIFYSSDAGEMEPAWM